ncbi:MAG: glycosyl hydrolase family 65 protein [Halofilum sp. (in: g-proteobacteria)]|nr:glycosyl hydrolase family 65 protein [Halofilum sp. (in: g-proteobacteria)]
MRCCERARPRAKTSWSSWDDISRRLRVPFHDGGIISQFEGYEALEEFDWEGYRERYGDIHRLDRILEAEGDSPNRYKASKQADVLMLFYLFSAEELRMLFEHLGYAFDNAIIPRTVLYYLERTAHGSTLSSVAHAWVLARAASARAPGSCFEEALDSDIHDVQGGTTPEGIHLGAMARHASTCCTAATWGSRRAATPCISTRPCRSEIDSLRVRLRYRRHKLDVKVDHAHLTVTSLPLVAAPITIAYRGRSRAISPGLTFRFPLVERDREALVDPRAQ